MIDPENYEPEYTEAEREELRRIEAEVDRLTAELGSPNEREAMEAAENILRIAKIDKLAEGGIVHPNAGMLWIPTEIGEEITPVEDFKNDEFFEELMEAMTTPIDPNSEYTNGCCFVIHPGDYDENDSKQ